MSAAVRYDQMTAAPVDDRTRQAKRRQLRAIVRELERRRTPDDLHPKQRIAFDSTATEILYGGAAGGGKSHLMRRAAVTWCTWISGLQVYLFRREFADLFKNHMEGPSGFPAMLAGHIARGEAKIIWGKNQIRFANGSVIHLCHCQHEKDVFGYQGAEIHVLMIDEITHWTRKMYTMLRSRVRLGGLKVPSWLAALFPRILLGGNPGGVGHNWVKLSFVDFAPPLAIAKAAKDDGGMRRQFIPAKLSDNPTQEQEEYRDRLSGINDKALADAMLEGNWDIVAGGMFDDVFKRSLHVIKPFAIPSSWRIDRSFDYGSSHPFSVGWWAESDGTDATMPDGTRRSFPRGTLFRINEWYGWDGKTPDVGLKMPVEKIADGIVEREKAMKLRERVKSGPADTTIFVAEPGRKSQADIMIARGVSWTEADKKPGSRSKGWDAMRSRFLAHTPLEQGLPMEEPGLFVFDHCAQFIRTVPTLPRDANDPDDVDTKSEDHVGDEARYRVTAPKHEAKSIPFIVSR